MSTHLTALIADGGHGSSKNEKDAASPAGTRAARRGTLMKYSFASLFLGSLLLGGCALDTQEVDLETEAARDSQDSTGQQGSSMEQLAVLEVASGHTLTFVSTFSEGDTERGSLVIESMETMRPSVFTHLGEKLGEDVKHGDLFYALSEPGTPVPEALRGSITAGAKEQQGWAKRALEESLKAPSGGIQTLAADIACDNDALAAAAPSNYPTVFERLDKTPATYASFELASCYQPPTWWYGICFDAGERYNYSAYWTGLTQWTGKICGTAIGDHTVTVVSNGQIASQWAGPEFGIVKAKNSSNCPDPKYYGSDWDYLPLSGGYFYKYITTPNVNYYHFAHYTGPTACLGLRVVGAKENDQFDFLMSK
ncbi:hypothetical protein [Polyangium sorediatum]|uniref:Uncharacterized protein n=1 Tax=Polyangium sorediatum TaxID=889274 RepID=A0ABT6P7L7_9BACT|nr:hypothetical protein [Polyangium sorediatum]MDI1436568.1 hypothetical protein [Polyangium sorediatum]